jgi:aminoglycoside phosphotransferase family enzyme/predicted kinase
VATETLIQALQNADLYDHPVYYFHVHETHCSWVILTGLFAYKIKKPVNFGFLNYTELAARQHFCEEEIKRNQLLAPDIYLNVISISGTEDQPYLQGTDHIIEYSVKMKEFPQDMMFSQLLEAGLLTPEKITHLAEKLAEFHISTEHVSIDNKIGTPEHAHQQVLDNFSQTLPQLTHDADKQLLISLEKETIHYYEKIKPFLSSRKKQGFIRKCHGDVHLNNIVWFNDSATIFDSIDFNNDFCWTDTMGDLGFILMDLEDKGQTRLAHLLLNRYLEITGDYGGLHVLPYYQAYRAMVRAKVASFRLTQPLNQEEYAQTLNHYQRCIQMAQHYLQARPASLSLLCGLSGSGKSTLAQKLVYRKGLIAITSDRERKRLFNIPIEKDCTDDVLQGLYSPSNTEKTYVHLVALTQIILRAGFSVIVDATFRNEIYRTLFRHVAEQDNLPFQILYCDASLETLKSRLHYRKQHSISLSEVTPEALEMQKNNFDAFTDKEKPYLVTLNTENSIDFDIIADNYY